MQWFLWVLPGVPTAFCPKRKIAPKNLERGNFHLPPIAASDSRHNLRPGTTLSRGAAGRVCLRALARRKIAPYDLARGDFNLSPITTCDSRHNSSQRTTVRRGAPGRVWEGVPAGAWPLLLHTNDEVVDGLAAVDKG